MVRTNVQLKDSYDIEPYLNSHRPAKYIVLMSSLRISSHKLNIENGKYCKHSPKPVSESAWYMYTEPAQLKMKFISDATVRDIKS